MTRGRLEGEGRKRRGGTCLDLLDIHQILSRVELTGDGGVECTPFTGGQSWQLAGLCGGSQSVECGVQISVDGLGDVGQSVLVRDDGLAVDLRGCIDTLQQPIPD